MDRATVIRKVTDIAERVGAPEGIEIVEVEWLGGGRNRLLRLTIDKPQGVTHGDCEFISKEVGAALDADDVIPGSTYNLEVTSPGVERKLTKARDYERFVGQKVKVVVREAVANQKHWEGVLAAFADGVITIEPGPGQQVQIPLDQVQRANLKFEW